MIPGENSIQTFNEYRSRYAATGEFPFLVTEEEEMEHIDNFASHVENDPAETIRSSLDVDLTKWLEERRKEAELYGFCANERLGIWPRESRVNETPSLQLIFLNDTNDYDFCLSLAKIDQPWHLPAIIDYGGGNECPLPVIQCVFFRYWQEKYGAEIAVVSEDSLECIVSRPPRTREAAIELAWEQYWYCNDIIDQGYNSISELAAELLNSPQWYFWWD